MVYHLSLFYQITSEYVNKEFEFLLLVEYTIME